MSRNLAINKKNLKNEIFILQSEEQKCNFFFKILILESYFLFENVFMFVGKTFRVPMAFISKRLYNIIYNLIVSYKIGKFC